MVTNASNHELCLQLKGDTLQLNGVQLSDQGYYIAQLLYPNSIKLVQDGFLNMFL